MASGIEIAGLALAVFPLVVGGIQFYADNVKTIRDMWHYEQILKSLGRELEMEMCKFENTCTLLLEGLVSETHLTSLMAVPGGPLWGVEDLQKKLENRLRATTVPHYMKAINELRSTLKTLQDQFKYDEDNKTGPVDRRALKKKMKGIRIVISKGEYKELLASITKINTDLATLTGQCKSDTPPTDKIGPAKHYNRIRDHAISLYEIFKERFQATPLCACALPHNANLRLEFRSAIAQKHCDRETSDRETSLRFNFVLSFQDDPAAQKSLPWDWREMGLEPLSGEEEDFEKRVSWKSKEPKEAYTPDVPDDRDIRIDVVSCIAPVVNKRGSNSQITKKLWSMIGVHSEPSTPKLEVPPYRSTTPTGRKSPNPVPKRLGCGDKPRGVSFNLSETSHIIPAAKTPDFIPRKTMEQIEDLCLAVQRGTNDLPCLGVLNGGGDKIYRVWQPKKPSFTCQPARVSSLESLLASPGELKRKDCLILGVQLASTVMQLHTTEWLNENWGKKDILFHKENTKSKTRSSAPTNHVIWKPLIRRIFTPPGLCSLLPQIPQAPPKSVLVRHDQAVFSLGVILIELWYGKCLEDLRIEADGTGGISNMTDYVTACRLIEDIYEKAGVRYGGAVDRCIRGLGHKNPKLEVDDFKNEVHANILSPLIENLESYCDMKLHEILEEEDNRYL